MVNSETRLADLANIRGPIGDLIADLADEIRIEADALAALTQPDAWEIRQRLYELADEISPAYVMIQPEKTEETIAC